MYQCQPRRGKLLCLLSQGETFQATQKTRSNTVLKDLYVWSLLLSFGIFDFGKIFKPREGKSVFNRPFCSYSSPFLGDVKYILWSLAALQKSCSSEFLWPYPELQWTWPSRKGSLYSSFRLVQHLMYGESNSRFTHREWLYREKYFRTSLSFHVLFIRRFVLRMFLGRFLRQCLDLREKR